ncbi:response regulator transcription factor [Pseudomonas sp. CFBP 13602]|uniref:response regulator transcription factor n=1 Tax=Pseudomonas sp. CFBP 13602 TaxID=2774039 RepID=UPI0017804CA8|nr:response regulator transcription factor [Pseudomonas sp. CFBP 13602]MBD8826143.1 response regulator transcription factor [Pseudomonas sp. CFBP 13602]
MNPSSPRLLVVDDHRKIREPLAIYLRRFGFDVRTTEDAAGMWALLKQDVFDVLILDVMLPDGDGFELCRTLAHKSTAAVILLTARDACADRVQGLDAGADDYVVKPFEPRELVARIHSVLRRRGTLGTTVTAVPPAQPAPLRCYQFADLSFRSGCNTLTRRDRSQVRLSTVEGRLLEVFLDHPNTVLGRERLIELTSRPGSDLFDRAIDRQISRLRRKLDDSALQPLLLQTVWGGGYRLAANVAQQPG